ncbi:glutaredoxin family protein [Anaerorhabdus sp.]|uniref:glutaredoxin family protein n=1 Tax=Anaerorhabdus sp. TaxID=1872524 RepID=UPI002FC94653
MKKIKMFMFDGCPHCKKALTLLDELKKEDKYSNVEIEMIDEHKNPEIADQYDYYYVPTFYVDEVKVHEGTVTLEQVKEVLDKAL